MIPVGSRVRLGLIGDNIRASRSPDLHRFAGQLCGLDVSYDLFIPPALNKDFETVFEECRNTLRGVNVTLPYKERVVKWADIADPLVRQMAAVNTVVFDGGRALGYNTDYSGFVAAFFEKFGAISPGNVVMIGAGGVGRAIGFGLVALDAERITICDKDAAKAEALGWALRKAAPGIDVCVQGELSQAMQGANGIINCTPVGMVGYSGSPVPKALLDGCKWAFEAVYTPVQTQFKTEAEAAGIDVLSGYELYFNQGIQAFSFFTGHTVADLPELRRRIAAAPVPD